MNSKIFKDAAEGGFLEVDIDPAMPNTAYVSGSYHDEVWPGAYLDGDQIDELIDHLNAIKSSFKVSAYRVVLQIGDTFFYSSTITTYKSPKSLAREYDNPNLHSIEVYDYQDLKWKVV